MCTHSRICFSKFRAASRFTCTHISSAAKRYIHKKKMHKTKKQEKKVLIAPSHPKSSHFCDCVRVFLGFGQANKQFSFSKHTQFSPKSYSPANRPSFLLRGFPFWASNSHKFDLHHVFSICSDRYQNRATSQISGISQLRALQKIGISSLKLLGF